MSSGGIYEHDGGLLHGDGREIREIDKGERMSDTAIELFNENLKLQEQVESLRAELSASAEVIKKTQDICDDTVRECLEVRGQLDAEKQRADALEAALDKLTSAVNADQSQLDKFSSFDRAYANAIAALEAARKPVPQEPKA